MQSRACPSPEELAAYDLGNLPQARLDEISDHLEACAACESSLDARGNESDAVVAALRRGRAQGEEAGSSLWDQLSSIGVGAKGVAEPPPRTIGNYEILGELGRGGMGVVYQARHLRLRRTVALKLLLGGAFADEHARARFRTEAEAVARLQHPHIVQLFEIGEYTAPDGPPRPFMALEFVHGESLSKRLSGKPQSPALAAAWVETLARATHYAHQQGIIHRDLKPANVLVNEEGELKICDFGVAKVAAGSDVKTLSGVIIGTAEYMAPEQAVGSPHVSTAVDIYALGAILYAMLAGRPPFQGASTLETLTQVQLFEAVPLRRLQPQVPRDLETICLRCLQKEPRKRYGSAQELAEDLHRFLSEEPIVARPTPTWERAWKWARRRPARAALIALSLFVLIVGFPLMTGLWLQANWAHEAEVRATGEAKNERDRAENERDRAEAALYAGRIRLADRFLHANDVESAKHVLDLCEPAAGRRDLRGWEWHYLKQLCKSDLFGEMPHGGDGHPHWVHAVAFLADGKRIVSASGMPGGGWAGYPGDANQKIPGQLKLWDAEGKCVQTLTPHAGAVWALAVSPNGQWAASASADGSIQLWDGKTLEIRSALPKGQSVYGLTFSPDSRLLAIDRSNELILWDWAGSRAVLQHPRAGFYFKSVFSPDGRRLLASQAGEGQVALWKQEAGGWQRTPHGLPGGDIHAGAFSPDARFLALVPVGSATIQMWDGACTKFLQPLSGHSNAITSLTFTPDGLLASGSNDGTVRLWSVEDGRERMVFRGHAAGVLSLGVNADSTRLISGGKDFIVKVWDVTRDPRGFAFPAIHGAGGEYLGNLGFTADGQGLQVVSPSAPAAYVLRGWNAGTGERVALEHRLEMPVKGLFRGFAFSADGRRLASGDPNDPQAVRVWSTESGAEFRASRTTGQGVTALALSADGQRLAYADRTIREGDPPVIKDAIRLRNLETDEELLLRAERPQLATRLAFSRDGRRLAVATLDVRWEEKSFRPVRRDLEVLDTATGETVSRIENAQKERCVALVFHPTGGQLAAIAEDGTLGVWDLAQSRPSYPPVQVSTYQTGIAFSPDGRRLAAAGVDSLVRLWDADTGNELLVLRGFGPPGTGHYGFTARVAFSPDGKRLAANDWSGHVNVWDAGEVTEEVRTTGHLPNKLRTLLRVAGIHARWGRWAEAATGYARALELQSHEKMDTWMEHGHALLLSGDGEGHRWLFRRMLEAYGKEPSPGDAYWIARLGALAPDGIEAAQLVELAAKFHKEQPANGIAGFGLALAHYRAGQFQDAIRRAHESLAAAPDAPQPHGDIRPLNWVVLTLAHKKLGQADEAKKWLAQAESWIKEESAEKDTAAYGAHPPAMKLWHDWLLLQRLRAEAQRPEESDDGPSDGPHGK